jgi:hypothetical protein
MGSLCLTAYCQSSSLTVCCQSLFAGRFDDVVARAEGLEAPIALPPHRNPPEGEGNGPGHREIWITDPDGYTVVASPDGEVFQPATR